MLTAFHRAVADTLVAVDLPPLSASARADVLEFVDGQLGALPPHLRLGVWCVAAGLATLTVLTTGRAPGALPVARRAALVERWAAGPLPPARLYVRLLRSLVVYAGHERPTEAA